MSAQPDSPSADDTAAPTQAIIEAIAAHEGVDVTDVEPPVYEPLYAVVNPEALDSLFRVPAASSNARVHLEYEGYEITVYADGSVDVADASIAAEDVERPLED